MRWLPPAGRPLDSQPVPLLSVQILGLSALNLDYFSAGNARDTRRGRLVSLSRSRSFPTIKSGQWFRPNTCGRGAFAEDNSASALMRSQAVLRRNWLAH